MRGVTKTFGGVPALDGVTLHVAPGEVHGLLGENGAGKTTLMNILYGLVHADAGEIHVNGRVVHIHSPRDARQAGIGMVHQHFKLVGTLHVWENFVLAGGRGWGLQRRGELEQAARTWFDRLGWPVDMMRRVDELSVGQQQRVEIVKALLAGGGNQGRVLVLDEPAAVLTPQETQELLAALRQLAAEGRTIILISHKLAEVQAICENVTVLRRGKVVFDGKMRATTTEELAEKMVGARVEMPALHRGPGAAPRSPTEMVLELRNVSSGLLKHASLRVDSGEIVGIAGVDGNGQAELVGAIAGTRRVESGEVRLAARNVTAQSVQDRAVAMAYVPEDRRRQGVVLPLSIEQNLMLKAYRRRRFSVMGWLKFGAWREYSLSLVKQFDVRCDRVTDPVGSLSGGNQQKVVLARELDDHRDEATATGEPGRDPYIRGAKRLVLAVNPTRGLDVGATASVMRQLLEARAAGAGVLLVHSDLDELLALSDRVLVLYGGKLTAVESERPTKDEVGRLMMGLGTAQASRGDAR